MKYSSNSILAYAPHNKEGEKIIKQSLFFREGLKKRIFLIDFIKSSSIMPALFQSKKQQELQEKALLKYRQFVKDTIQNELPKEILFRIKSGDPASALINESKKGGYEFIIIDKSNAGYRGGLSYNDMCKFISKSHCPVLTINKDYPVEQINKIIIPIDISQAIKKKLYWSTLFAKKFNAKIHIVSALNIDIKEKGSLAHKNAEKIKKMLHERGLDCDFKILKTHQRPKHDVILDYIDEEKPELVIIRTHKEFRFSGKKAGKFVSEIIYRSKVPVFSVGGVTTFKPEDIK